MKSSKYGNTRTQIVASIFFAAMMGMALLLPPTAEAADTILTLATSYQPSVQETTDASGFKHPGVGLTKPILENLRTQVRAQKEPWNTNFNNMLLSSAASKTVTSSNQGEPGKPASYAFNSQSFNSRFIADGQKAFTQAILYFVTGDETYRANALAILRIWAQMDPAQYVYFNDAHIHTGVPLYRMTTAAEILRYTSYQTPALQWTDQDSANLTNNLIVPATETFNYSNWRFMNQHLYPLMGSMAGYIFTGNLARYDESVEWFTVNATAVDQGKNGALKRLFRLVDTNDLTAEPVTPVVQLVEMGRDQAHSTGDLTNADVLARLLMAQGTKVDPANGMPSTAANAVGPYEFLNDRILDTADYWGRYMLGYETPWVPTAAYANADGTPSIVYKTLASGYRGRLTQNSWGSYYYYKYARGFNMDQRAPCFTEAYRRRTAYNWDSVDGGGEFWLYIPAAAEAEGAQFLVRPIVEPIREFEHRFTALDSSSVAMLDATAGFARVTPTATGSKIALTSYANGSKNIAFRIRTNGVAALEAFGDSIALPDTKGQWRYVTHALNEYQWMGDMFYITVTGAGATVDLDHINLQPGTALSAPVFTEGGADLSLYTYAASSSTISRSFAATDANPGDVVSYQIDNMPAGATFNTGTGAFSWKPTQAGTYTFAVTATDGATVSTRLVKVVVTADRQSAVAAANAGFQASTTYIGASLATYNAAYADALAAVSGATDDAFAAQLTALGNAVAGLQLLTPLIDDGSMNYAKMLAWSTFGSSVPNALDNAPDSFVVYTLAQNLSHTLDFGVNYRVSASSFQLQVRASFPTRIGGVALFGSNDNETWTRLTPGLSAAVEEMQTLAVQDDLKESRYRFIKMQMVKPSSSMLELSEFRIFGTRHEAVNQLSAVSISSDQSLKKRIVPGNTVKVTITAVAPINNLRLTLQGQPVSVTTADNLNWTATWVAPATVDTATVKLVLNYKTAAGLEADTTYFTTDGTTLFISDQTNDIGNLLDIAALSDSNGRTATDVRSMANSLFDSNITTFTDFRLNGSGTGSYLTFDFKEDGSATLSRAELLGRQDQPGRAAGTVVQGSNDNASWTTISGAAASSADWQQLAINSPQPYRYVRIYNGGAWYGNLSELRLHGVAQSNKMATVSISSPQSLRNRIAPGNSVTLTFTAKEAVSNVSATIQGQAATVATADNINFTATATLPQGVATGTVTFALNYKLQSGMNGVATSATTDGTTLYLVDESDVIRNVPAIAALIDSTVNRTAAATLTQVNALFDGALGSVSDFRTGTNNAGYGAYITFDFKEDGSATLSGIDLLARQDQYYTRIAGTVVQGSNDNASWTTISGAAASTAEWQQLAINPQSYRYIRIYNGGNWFGNIAELRLRGVAQSNKVASLSISSHQALRTRIVPGNAVQLTFTAKEAVNNISATIQGQAATVATADNVNFTATATLPQGVALGTVTFALNYKLQSGMNGVGTSATTDSTTLYLVDETDVIRNLPAVATLIDSTVNRTAAATLTTVNALFDGALGSVSDFRTGTNNAGYGAYITFDFKEDGSATLSGVDLLARQDQYYTRIAGTVVQGSNDNASWTTISGAAASTAEWQQLAINPQPYRYIRIYNGGNWFGNIAELRLRGVAQSNKVASVSISSPQALRNRIVPGNSVQLSFTTKEAVTNVSASIQGQAATVATSDSVNFTATATLPQGVAPGALTFAINYKLPNGATGFTTTATTDSSALYLVDEADVIRNLSTIATLIDSTYNRPMATTVAMVNSLGDGNLGTVSDFRAGTNNAGNGAYVIFDFTSNEAILSSVELAARQDNYYTRANGVVIQGSNDKTNWSALTAPAASTPEWQTLPVTGAVPYRYLRIYNGAAWYGNLSEVRFHGVVQPN